MTTLDEAIKHAEEIAESRCDECGREHKQLALWLKELKEYREQEPTKQREKELAEEWKCGYEMGFEEAKVFYEEEPCEDAISRQAVLDGLKGCFCEEWVKTLFTTMVKQLPSVRPQEPKTGHWKRISMDRYTTHAQYWYECDKCGEHNLGNTDFCPNCGARMERSDKE